MSLRIFTSSDIGLYTSPASGTNLDTGDTTPLGSVNLRTATPVNFTLTYDGSGNLAVGATQGANTFTKTFASGSLGVPLTGLGGYAYLGFTGGDGSNTATQQISNFSMAITPGTASQGPAVNVLPVNTPLTVNASGTFDLDGGTQAIGSLSARAWSPTATPAAFIPFIPAPPC